ncbi:hypothetical protein GCM10028819_14310 [Spirosoma humi]
MEKKGGDPLLTGLFHLNVFSQNSPVDKPTVLAFFRQVYVFTGGKGKRHRDD